MKSSNNVYIKDLLKAWVAVIVVAFAKAMLLTGKWSVWRYDFTGIYQFYPLFFFLILTLLRVITIGKSEKNSIPSKRGYTERQFQYARFFTTVIVPLLLVGGMNAFSKYNLLPVKWLWIVEVVIYCILLNIIIITFEIHKIYFYNLPIFIFTMIFLILGTESFAYILTLILARSVIVGLIILLGIAVIKVGAEMAVPHIIFRRK